MNEDQRYWRDVLTAMDDLIVDWQCRPCECRLGDLEFAHVMGCDDTLCKRCRIVSLVTRFKAELEG